MKFLFSCLLVLVMSLPTVLGQDAVAGEALYKGNCSQCHRIKGMLIGPQLSGVNQKYAGDEEWLYSWIKNAPGMIIAKDEKAVALFEQYKTKGMMQAFPGLSDEDISNILAYVQAEDDKAAVPVEADKPKTEAELAAEKQLYYTLLSVVIGLAAISILLVFIAASLVTAVRAKEQKEPFTWKDAMARTKLVLQNKFVLAVITAVVVIGGAAKSVELGTTTSLHQGYMPEQPIKFSHKLHAGENNIECEYCHSGVTKSKSAWIPSVNVCMNCHKYISEGPTYGTEEIAKIYEAAGWDPNTAEYSKEPQGVEWVRIHNLPDHAYFNHAQHYQVGKIECQTCHGEVQEMEVLYQHAPLSMGWCINCHREEKVKVLGKETDMTVEDMGGLDCARCHY